MLDLPIVVFFVRFFQTIAIHFILSFQFYLISFLQRLLADHDYDSEGEEDEEETSEEESELSSSANSPTNKKSSNKIKKKSGSRDSTKPEKPLHHHQHGKDHSPFIHHSNHDNADHSKVGKPKDGDDPNVVKGFTGNSNPISPSLLLI